MLDLRCLAVWVGDEVGSLNGYKGSIGSEEIFWCGRADFGVHSSGGMMSCVRAASWIASHLLRSLQRSRDGERLERKVLGSRSLRGVD